METPASVKSCTCIIPEQMRQGGLLLHMARSAPGKPLRDPPHGVEELPVQWRNVCEGWAACGLRPLIWRVNVDGCFNGSMKSCPS